MAKRRTYVITGAAAWVGGMATALVASSCEPEVDASDREAVIVAEEDAEECDPSQHAPAQVSIPEVCDMMARPSAMVHFVRSHQDYSVAVEPEHIWFEHNGEVHDAMCLPSGDGCAAWITGYELPGRIEVFAEYCDTVVSEAFDVGLTADGCHVDTRFIKLEAATRGCLAAGPDPADPPPSPGPTEVH